jgi:tricorn protease-like protein
VTSPPPAGCVVDEAVAVVDVKTGAVQQITPAADFAGDPAFSPNGDEISYFSRAGAHPGLDVMTSFGTYVRQVDDSANVTCDSCGDVESGWSPDGRLLVFSAADRNRVLNLFTISALGGEAKQLTHSGNDLHMPDWTALVTTCTVPKLKGHTVAMAKRQIELAGCAPGKVTGPTSNPSSRHVIRQTPSPNTDVKIGTRISIDVR